MTLSQESLIRMGIERTPGFAGQAYGESGRGLLGRDAGQTLLTPDLGHSLADELSLIDTAGRSRHNNRALDIGVSKRLTVYLTTSEHTCDRGASRTDGTSRAWSLSRPAIHIRHRPRQLLGRAF